MKNIRFEFVDGYAILEGKDFFVVYDAEAKLFLLWENTAENLFDEFKNIIEQTPADYMTSSLEILLSFVEFRFEG